MTQIGMFDSINTVKNIQKRGGPKPDLTELTKQLVLLLKTLEVTFIPKWLPRSKNARADALSKEWACKRDLQRDLHYALAAHFGQGVVVTAQEFTKIPTWLERHQGDCPAVLVHPKWESQPWWPKVARRRIQHVDLGVYNQVFEYGGDCITPSWQFQASLFFNRGSCIY